MWTRAVLLGVALCAYTATAVIDPNSTACVPDPDGFNQCTREWIAEKRSAARTDSNA